MHRSIAPLLLLLTALSTSLACARSPGEVFARDGAAPPPHAAGRAMGLSAMAASAPEMADVGGATADRLLRKSASLGIEVPEEEVESTAARAEQIVAGAGGTTERSSRNADDSAMLDFRVPADRLDATIEALAALGETTHRSSQAVDVTDQAIDLEAKIGNLRGLRDRLRALLDRATKVEEILQIERELHRVLTQLDML